MFAMPRFSIGLAVAILVFTACARPAPSAEKTIRSAAVVDLTFDENAGDALDRAVNGKSKDTGKLINGARRVASPFWNQRGKKALLFNAARKQYVQVADSADVGRSIGVTVSFFFLNRHPANDAAARGIVAKRIDTGDKSSATFGINYASRADVVQPYINDGQFRVPQFSLKEHVGTRRLVYLTATFELADAPEPDKDTDKDDLRIRLFVNGKQVKPKNAINSVAVGSDVWVTDVNIKRLLNDTPLTLGATNDKVEHASCVIDEFTLFERALSPQEVAALFKEVAGDNADKLAAKELQPPRDPAPAITAMSLNGLQLGSKTRLVITGKDLAGNPVVHLPIKGVKQQIVNGSNAGRVVLDVTVPPSAASGYYPLRIQTDEGLSNPKTVVVDNLPQVAAGSSSREKPADLPTAVSGTIAGAQREQVYFKGKKGQHIIADVEAKRLGAGLDPVLEIKTARGTPLKIAWGRVNLQGDARAEATLPADGLYSVELHDLEFKAPGANAYRLKVGELKLVDAWFPPAVNAGGKTTIQPIGAGVKDVQSVAVTADAKSEYAKPNNANAFHGPLPPVEVSEGREFVEPAEQSKQPPVIDARFEAVGTDALFINGRILSAGEDDRYVLNVQPGQRLSLKLLGRAIHSPIDAAVTVRALPGKNVLSTQQDAPGTRDPSFSVAVPKDAKQIEVAVRDLHRRFGPHYFYRLRIAPAGRPDFSLAVVASQLSIPAGGSGFLQLQVNRAGYNGPIQLRLDGRDDIDVTPKTIPAGRAGQVFVTVIHRGRKSDDGFQSVRLIGEANVGRTSKSARKKDRADLEVRTTNNTLRRIARLTNASQTIPGWETKLPMIVGRPAPYSVRVSKTPPALFKGAFVGAALELKRPDSLKGQAVRLSLISTERPRRKNPRQPRQGNKPLVRAFPGQSIPPDAAKGRLLIAVPQDVAEKAIEFVVKAELVPHAYSDRVLATTYSQPFRVPVKTAVAVEVDAKSLNLAAGNTNTVRGTIKRTAGFNRPVTVQLTGLPTKDFQTKPVTVPADKSTFEIPVTAAAEKKLRVLQKINLTVTVRGNRALIPPKVIALKVAPAKKKP